MKKLIGIMSLILCLAILSSCGGAVIDVDAYEWGLQSAVKTNTTLNTSQKIDFENVSLTARNGKITVNDKATGAVYSGAYMVTGSNSEGSEYSLSVGSSSGNAILSLVDYEGERAVPTLTISLTNGNERYNLSFKAKK